MRRILAVMIVAALAAFVARPGRFQDMLWLWRFYGPLLQPRPGVSQPLGLYGYQAMLLGYGTLLAWAAIGTLHMGWRKFHGQEPF